MSDIYIYGDIVNDAFTDSDYTAKKFVEELKNCKGAVTVHINSNGGDVFNALTISNFIKNRGDIEIQIDGVCASAATLIACAGSKITAAKNSLIMTHLPAIAVCDLVTEKELSVMQESLLRVKQSILEVYAERLKVDVADISTMLDVETWYTAEEALNAGLIDSISGEVETQVNDYNQSVIVNGLKVHGNFKKLKEKTAMNEQNLLDKIKNLLSNNSEIENKVRDQEISRLKELNAARSENLSANAIIDVAISSGDKLSDVQKYLDAVKSVAIQDNDATAQAIIDIIKDNLNSGAAGVVGSGEQIDAKKQQADLIAKFANS